MKTIKAFIAGLEKSGGKTVFGVTYFTSDEIHCAIIESAENGQRTLFDESFKIASQPGEADLKRISAALARFSSETVWVHVVLRGSGLVKTFSIPEHAPSEKAAVLQAGVRKEIPHLVDEVIYHAMSQRKEDVEASGLMFGIPKNVLKDQAEKLGQLGIVPSRIVLSTELLFHYFSANGARPHELCLLAFPYGDAAELLYVKKEVLLQSQWFKFQSGTDRTIKDQIETAANGYTRSSHEVNCKTVIEDARTALYKAAIEGCRNGSVFDFSPPELDRERENLGHSKTKTRLSRSFLFLTASFLIFSICQVISTGAQIGWIKMKAAPLSLSVKNTKDIRRKALSSRDFQSKKAVPLLVLDALRQPASSGLVITELEYDLKRGTFTVWGEAVRQHLVDNFVTALQDENLFQVHMNRIETSDTDSGSVISFELTGDLGEGGAA